MPTGDPCGPDPYPWSIRSNEKFYLYQATLLYIYICIYTFANRCGTNLLYVTQSYHTSGSPRNDPYPFFEPHPQVCPLYNYLYACIPHYCSFIHPFIHSVIHSFSHSVIHSSIHPSIHSVSHSFIHPSIHPFIHSFIHSFIIIIYHLNSSSRPKGEVRGGDVARRGRVGAKNLLANPKNSALAMGNHWKIPKMMGLISVYILFICCYMVSFCIVFW